MSKKLISETQLVSVTNSKSILVNLINGNADVIRSSAIMRVGDSLLVDDDSLVPSLKARGYFFDKKEQYASYINSVERTLRDQSDLEPPNFLYVPTYSCNLNCYYCYQKAYPFTAPDGHNNAVQSFFSATDRIVATYEKRAKNGYRRSDVLLTITGGEPLQKHLKDDIERLLSGCVKRGYTPSIVTNGYELLEFLDLIVEYGVKDVQLTLDGSKRVHDSIRVCSDGAPSYARIVDAIEKLSCYTDDLHVRINATKRNISSIAELAPLISKYNNVLFYVYLMQQEGCFGNANTIVEIEGIKQLSKMKKEIPGLDRLLVEYHGRSLIEGIFNQKQFRPKTKVCAAMGNQYIFDFSGRVFKCWWGIGNESFAVGSFSDIGVKLDPDRERLYRNRSISSLYRCSDCKYRFLCGGGCTGKMSREQLANGTVTCPNYSEIIDFMVSDTYNGGCSDQS